MIQKETHLKYDRDGVFLLEVVNYLQLKFDFSTLHAAWRGWDGHAPVSPLPLDNFFYNLRTT